MPLSKKIPSEISLLQIIAQVEPTFIMARGVHLRELSSKSYASEIFALSQIIAETPYSILCSVVFFFLWYYIPGFPKEGERAGYAYFCKPFFFFLSHVKTESLTARPK